jgi:hypothetical protein
LLASGDHSDLILRCNDGKIFNVHKAVVCAQSEFFSKACEKSRFKEGQTSQIDLQVDDSKTIANILEYLYLLDYVVSLPDEREDGPLLSIVKVYVAADFFIIPALKQIAQMRFETTLAKASKATADLSEAVKFAYETLPECDQGLRKAMVNLIIQHDFLKDAASANGPTLCDTMMDCPAFARDYAVTISFRWRGLSMKLKCPQCEHLWADSRAKMACVACPGCSLWRDDWELASWTK